MVRAPFVDIVMPTYNHEKFVAEAIESVLMQKTGFEYRLNICDDCSTDKTQEIIQKYAQANPDRVSAVLSSEHRGIIHEERLSIKILKSCTAKYVALLEGDDYWTDPYKLQKQVDYLDKAPECVMCFHDAEVVDEHGTKRNKTYCSRLHKQLYGIEDLLKGNYIPTLSVMFRNHLIKEFPGWFGTLSFGDWPLHLLHAEFGKIAYLNEVLGVYRVHQGGAWSGQDQIERLKNTIAMYGYVNKHFSHKYEPIIKSEVQWCFYRLSIEYEKRRSLKNARRCILQSILHGGVGRGSLQRKKIRRLIHLFGPSAASGYQRSLLCH